VVPAVAPAMTSVLAAGLDSLTLAVVMPAITMPTSGWKQKVSAWAPCPTVTCSSQKPMAAPEAIWK